MARKYFDCRNAPESNACTVSIAADGDQELEDAVVQHAVSVHGYKDSSELRGELRKAFKPARD